MYYFQCKWLYYSIVFASNKQGQVSEILLDLQNLKMIVHDQIQQLVVGIWD